MSGLRGGVFTVNVISLQRSLPLAAAQKRTLSPLQTSTVAHNSKREIISERVSFIFCYIFAPNTIVPEMMLLILNSEEELIQKERKLSFQSNLHRRHHTFNHFFCCKTTKLCKFCLSSFMCRYFTRPEIRPN